MSSATGGCISLVRLYAWGWRANRHGVARRATATRLASAIIPVQLAKVRCVLRIPLDGVGLPWPTLSAPGSFETVGQRCPCGRSSG